MDTNLKTQRRSPPRDNVNELRWRGNRAQKLRRLLRMRSAALGKMNPAAKGNPPEDRSMLSMTQRAMVAVEIRNRDGEVYGYYVIELPDMGQPGNAGVELVSSHSSTEGADKIAASGFRENQPKRKRNETPEGLTTLAANRGFHHLYVHAKDHWLYTRTRKTATPPSCWITSQSSGLKGKSTTRTWRPKARHQRSAGPQSVDGSRTPEAQAPRPARRGGRRGRRGRREINPAPARPGIRENCGPSQEAPKYRRQDGDGLTEQPGIPQKKTPKDRTA